MWSWPCMNSQYVKSVLEKCLLIMLHIWKIFRRWCCNLKIKILVGFGVRVQKKGWFVVLSNPDLYMWSCWEPDPERFNTLLLRSQFTVCYSVYQVFKRRRQEKERGGRKERCPSSFVAVRASEDWKLWRVGWDQCLQRDTEGEGHPRGDAFCLKPSTHVHPRQ